MDERLLSVYDLSARTKWKLGTIYKKSASGEIPGRVKLGYSLRFRESEIDAWLKAQKGEGSEDAPPKKGS